MAVEENEAVIDYVLNSRGVKVPNLDPNRNPNLNPNSNLNPNPNPNPN